MCEPSFGGARPSLWWVGLMQGMASTRGERGSASCRSRSPPTPAAGSQDSFRRPLWFPPALTDCRFGQPTSFSPTFPSKERCTPRVMCSTLPYIRATPWRCSRCSEAPERELRCVWGESLVCPRFVTRRRGGRILHKSYARPLGRSTDSRGVSSGGRYPPHGGTRVHSPRDVSGPISGYPPVCRTTQMGDASEPRSGSW